MADEAKWYVLHTYSGYENAVADSIKKAAENRRMQDRILDVNIPMETVTEVIDNQNKTVERKVFPGYVLVKMIMTNESWHLVRNVRGVTGFVGANSDSPNKKDTVSLTDAEVQALGVDRREVVVRFHVGDTVHIIDGPMEGQNGVVDDIDVEKSRVGVIVTLFKREISTMLDFDQIEVIEH